MNYRFNNPQLLKDNRIRKMMREDYFRLVIEEARHFKEFIDDQVLKDLSEDDIREVTLQ